MGQFLVKRPGWKAVGRSALPLTAAAAWSRAARRVGWGLSWALVVLLLQSAFWTSRVPLTLKLTVAVVAVLAAVRPADALVAVAGLVPFGHVLVTGVWNAYPFAFAEAVVLAFLAGYLWHERRALVDPTAANDSLVVAAQVYALIVLASCLVQLSVVRVWHEYPIPYALTFVSFLATDYLTMIPDPRPWVDGRGFLSTGLLLVEGAALLLCARTLCRQRSELARRLMTAMVSAGAGTAALSFVAILQSAGDASQPLGAILQSARWSSPALPSLNTAGPYFLFVAFLAIGLAATSVRWLVPGLLAASISAGAMWLTQTRSAIVAGLAAVVACAVWLAAGRWRWRSPLRTVLVAGIVAIFAAGYIVAENPLGVLPAGGRQSLQFRAMFAQTALRMVASAPILGVGIDQYVLRYPEFAPRELLQYYSRNDAHNYLLWLGAELGLFGLASFLWILGIALAGVWKQLRSRPHDWRVLAISAGLGAFMMTWLIGQPMSIPLASYTFWIVLGLASVSPVTEAGAIGTRARPLRHRLVLAAAVVFLIASVPVRAFRAIAEIDLSRVSYGFEPWLTGAAGERFRRAGSRATVFMRSSTRSIEIPIAADRSAGVDILVMVDGNPADRLTLGDKSWHKVRLNAPTRRRPYWRVDLHAAPRGASEAAPVGFRREATIRVGEISILAVLPTK